MSLFYKPLNMFINYNSKYIRCRIMSQLKWYILCDDNIENMNNRVMSCNN